MVGQFKEGAHVNDRYMVTGGAGFIGSNLVNMMLSKYSDAEVLIYDSLTYAGNLDNVSDWVSDRRLRFVRGDVCDREHLRKMIERFEPHVIFHLAAESHVDRSIGAPTEFVRTNVDGTLGVLEAVRATGVTSATPGIRMVHVSTDEVYGSMHPGMRAMEGYPYRPNSPYAASKAAADLLVRAYVQTYNLPVITTHCTNNYGPFQFPEKLIPLLVLRALDGKSLPVYGDGQHVRDWIHVADHCAALYLVAERGIPGETYNIGINDERSNLDVVREVCHALNRLAPRNGLPYSEQIEFVTDRPGHDRRYALDASKAQALGFEPTVMFKHGIMDTVEWYIAHRYWCDRLRSVYQQQRLGLVAHSS